MDTLQEMKSKRAKAVADAQALLLEADGTTPRTMSEEDRVAFDALLEDEKSLTAEIDKEVAAADAVRLTGLAAANARMREPEARISAPMETNAAPGAVDRTIPATARRVSNLVAFRGEGAELSAYRFGVWFAALNGMPWALQRLRDQGMTLERAASEGVNTAGGFLVPDEFENTIIDIREEYGSFRQHARITPMAGDTKRVPRTTGGLTAHFVGESAAGTESQKTWDQVGLTAKKLIVLSQYSNELGEDAIINVGDDLVREVGIAFAHKEDLCGYIGDGNNTTYGGIVGITIAHINLGVILGGGRFIGTGSLGSEITLEDFVNTAALLPAYADNANAKWFCHKAMFGDMQRLEAAAGGNAIVDIQDGMRKPMFLGYPVVYVPVMHDGNTDTVSLCLALLGDMRQAVTLGARRGTTIAVSDSALNSFEKDELTIRGTERFDIVVHDIGTADEAGPVVALIGKAS